MFNRTIDLPVSILASSEFYLKYLYYESLQQTGKYPVLKN